SLVALCPGGGIRGAGDLHRGIAHPEGGERLGVAVLGSCVLHPRLSTLSIPDQPEPTLARWQLPRWFRWRLVWRWFFRRRRRDRQLVGFPLPPVWLLAFAVMAASGHAAADSLTFLTRERKRATRL